MNYDKKKVSNLGLLLLSSIIIFISIPFRLFKPKKRKRIIFYYQMHGNSKALADSLQKTHPEYELYYLAYPHIQEIYKSTHSLKKLSPLSLGDMIKVARSDMVVTDYGCHNLLIYAILTDIKFVDLWHGIPILKKPTPQKVKYLNLYDLVLVSSDHVKNVYQSEFMIKTEIQSAGFGRTDVLFNKSLSGVREKLGLPEKKIILFAPTWKPADADFDNYAFGMSEEEFVKKINTFAKKNDYFVIFRSHLLSGSGDEEAKLSNVRAMPVNRYPYTEEVIAASDILVTDWSSIAFDYLATGKPVVFFDSPIPFLKGESDRAVVGNRFSDITHDLDELEQTVSEYLKNPKKYEQKNKDKIKRIIKLAYGKNLDGKITQRYEKAITKLLG
jgi:CDP-glycerol glycerophosphotransferase